jgi:hypothetical protein
MPLGVKQEQAANPLKASLFRDTLEVRDTELRVPPQGSPANSWKVGNPYLGIISGLLVIRAES